MSRKKNIKRGVPFGFSAFLLLFTIFVMVSCGKEKPDYQRAKYDPIHFMPAIAEASNEDCLQCHKEILENRVKPMDSIRGKKNSDKAFYQHLATYEGKQSNFHYRHLLSPYANEVMDLKCNFCHQGNDPREESPNMENFAKGNFTMRKMVNPEEICLRCHGQHPYQLMSGLTGPWEYEKDKFQNNCLSCHAGIRMKRHDVDYLHKENIEKLAKEKGGDVCFGCHGGRPWYKINYPYTKGRTAQAQALADKYGLR